MCNIIVCFKYLWKTYLVLDVDVQMEIIKYIYLISRKISSGEKDQLITKIYLEI